jgi:predicted MPP superfamily phosphohydrolase
VTDPPAPPPPGRFALTRRRLWRLGAAAFAASLALPAYAFGIEPRRLAVTRYRLRPQGWPAGLSLRIAALADLHVGEPYMGLDRIAEIVAATNALAPDLVVLLGDYAPSSRHFISRHIAPEAMGGVLAGLRAPLGRYAVLGNHDYWNGVARWIGGLHAGGITVLQNTRAPLAVAGQRVWLAGTASSVAIRLARRRFQGLDNLPATLARIPEGEPVILLAHEPDIFPRVPPRVALTMCGHTHGGQVRLLGWSPRVPSKFGNRFAYGHVEEAGRHLIVSGGLGFSTLPVRLGVPPEIVLVTLGDDTAQLHSGNVDAPPGGLRHSAA